jgi:hypothetical protein
MEVKMNKKFLCVVVSVLCFLWSQSNLFSVTTPITIVSDNEVFPVTISVEVYPNEISYGDICFGRFFATNQKEKTVNCVYGSIFLDITTTELLLNEERLQYFNTELFDEHDGFCTACGIRTAAIIPNHSLRHNETMLFHLKPIWIPIHELTDPALPQQDSFSKLRSVKFDKFIEQGKKDFDLMFNFSGVDMPSYRSDGKEFKDKMVVDIMNMKPSYTFVPEIFTKKELQAKGYKLSDEISTNIKYNNVGQYHYVENYKLQYGIRILPRSKKILAMIHQWYLQIPNTVDLHGHWTGHGLFAHPHHAKDSPYYDYKEENYEKFFSSMRTRTPELLSRIKRTKELETELLKLSDAELSQNMKEFIKLRGYLVDIRFAENVAEEEKAFNNFVTFIERSKDKELWIRFVVEIAFDSIIDNEHFPHEKVQNYRKRFAEKFTSSKEVLK